MLRVAGHGCEGPVDEDRRVLGRTGVEDRQAVGGGVECAAQEGQLGIHEATLEQRVHVSESDAGQVGPNQEIVGIGLVGAAQRALGHPRHQDQGLRLLEGSDLSAEVDSIDDLESHIDDREVEDRLLGDPQRLDSVGSRHDHRSRVAGDLGQELERLLVAGGDQQRVGDLATRRGGRRLACARNLGSHVGRCIVAIGDHAVSLSRYSRCGKRGSE